LPAHFTLSSMRVPFPSMTSIPHESRCPAIARVLSAVVLRFGLSPSRPAVARVLSGLVSTRDSRPAYIYTSSRV
jgi:hypothetical protein